VPRRSRGGSGSIVGVSTAHPSLLIIRLLEWQTDLPLDNTKRGKSHTCSEHDGGSEVERR
jgi:hypothetical protein